MDPRDFLEVAKDLLKKDTPANCRTVFNRSYYAAFNLGAKLLREAGVNIPMNANGHGKVGKYLGNCGIKELEEAQSKLSMLQADRIAADYRLAREKVEKMNNAKKAVMNSERVLRTLEQFNTKAQKKKIRKGVSAYESKIKSASRTAHKH